MVEPIFSEGESNEIDASIKPARALRLLVVQILTGIGGSENYLLELLPALSKKGFEPVFAPVIVRSKANRWNEIHQLYERFASSGISVQPMFGLVTFDPSIPKKIADTYAKGRFDLVNSHLIHADSWCAFAKKYFQPKMRIVSTIHSYSERDYARHALQPASVPQSMYRLLFKWSRKQIDKSYAVSESLRAFLLQAGLIRGQTINVIHHGFPQEIPLPPVIPRLGNPQLIVPGRLIPRKNHLEAIKQLPNWVKLYPQIKLVIAGSGPLERSLWRLVRKLEVVKHVYFTGYTDNLKGWIAASDVVLVPSLAEGLPLIVFEAFQMNRPVVAFDTVGIRDLVMHKKTGWLANPFESDSFDEGVRTLIDNTELVTQLTSNARKLLCSQFRIENMVSHTGAVFHEVCEIDY